MDNFHQKSIFFLNLCRRKNQIKLKKSFKTLPLLIIIIFCFFNTSLQIITLLSTTETCSQDQIQNFILWTKKHRKEFLILSTTEFIREANCQTILVQIEKLPVSLMWVELPLLNPSKPVLADGSLQDNPNCNFLLIKNSKTQKWEFAQNKEIPSFETTCNSVYLAEKEDGNHLSRKNRIESILRESVLNTAFNIKGEDFFWLQESYYISDLLWLDKVRSYFIFMIFAIDFERKHLMLAQNFDEYLIPVLQNESKAIFDMVSAKIKSLIDHEFESQMFGKISTQIEFVNEKFQMILAALNLLKHTIPLTPNDHERKKDSNFDYILLTLNQSGNKLSLAKLIAFTKSYALKIQEIKADCDIIQKFITEKTDPKNKNYSPLITDRMIANVLVDHISRYKPYNIQSFLLNKMESKGYSVKQKTNGLVNLFKYGFSKKNNCNLNEEQIQNLIEIAIERKWLNSEYFYADPPTRTFRRCSLLEESGNVYLSVLFNPMNEARCEIVYKIENTNQNPIIISETSNLYWYGVTCNRYIKELQQRMELINENEDHYYPNDFLYLNPYMIEPEIMNTDPAFRII